MRLVLKNILFCYSRLPGFTNAVHDYVRAFGQHSRHRIHYYDMDSGPISFALEPFDAIIFNYCFWARCLAVTPDFRARVAAFPGLKVAIFQDEYDCFLWHERTVVALCIQTIITCVPQAHWRDVFRGQGFDKVRFINALTGYVPDALLDLPVPAPMAQRPWVVGYRGRPVPFVYGRLTQEKLWIGQRMRQVCAERGIAADIAVSEEARIYGASWPAFIGSCRTVLGTESGSNVFDFDGTLKPAVQAYLQQHPDADFETVHQRFLRDYDGKIRMNQISPRVFEAIALRTGLILFEGHYSGVIRPWEHFIPLRKDFANVDEVLAAAQDIAGLEAMTRRAYDEVIASGRYHYRSFIAQVDAHVDECVPVGRGLDACYGLLGWRQAQDEALKRIEGPRGQLPTAQPLSHLDPVPDPVWTVRFNGQALRRAVMRRYEALLYSAPGRRLRRALADSPLLFRLVQKIARMATGRW
jgi:hypothetical protein